MPDRAAERRRDSDVGRGLNFGIHCAAVSSFIALTNGLLNRFDDAEIERPHARLDAMVTKPGNGAVSSLAVASGDPTDAADEAAEDPANAEADLPL
jgi:hypothetical protein